ncbi:hypothetical protein FHS64_001774 [Brevundimonas terrae]|nr:hypothetical protein [Brevundimonas terrae]
MVGTFVSFLHRNARAVLLLVSLCVLLLSCSLVLRALAKLLVA